MIKWNESKEVTVKVARSEIKYLPLVIMMIGIATAIFGAHAGGD